MRVRWLGTAEYDYADSSRYEDQNTAVNRVQMPANGWITGLGAHVAGLDAATPGRLVLYYQMHDLAIQSNLQSWNTVLQERTYDIPNQDAIRVKYSHHYFVGFWTDPRYTRRWRQKLNVAWEHWRSTIGQLSVPLRVTAWGKQGHALSCWVKFVANEQPMPGRWRSSPSGQVGSLSPVFSGYLEHPEGEGGLDRTEAVHMIIYNETTGQTVVNRRIEITNTENAQGYFEQQFYTHAPGNTYQARYRHVDSWGWWSEFSPVARYTVAEGPEKPTLTSPIGKVGTLNPSYQGTYSHPAGTPANAVQLRLQNDKGTLLLGESGVLAMTGTSFSVAHNTIAQFPALVQGRGYRWLARVRDNQNRWSGWSEAQIFTTNYAPFVPTSLSPSGGIYDRGGVLSATVRDPDGDVIQEVQFEVKNAAGTTLATYPRTVAGPWASGDIASLNASANLTLGQTYSWRVRASDGSLYGPWSEFVTFTYANYPTANILAPVYGGLVNAVSTPSAEYGPGSFLLEGVDTNHSLTTIKVQGAAYGETVWRLTKSGGNGISRVALDPAARFVNRTNKAFLGVWMRAPTGTMSMTLRLECYNATGVSLGTVAPLTHPDGRTGRIAETLTGIWRRYGMFTDALPVGTATVRPYVEFTGTSTGTAEVDAWHVYFLDSEPPAAARYWFGYFDGESGAPVLGNFRWSGVPGASPSIGVNILTNIRPTISFAYIGDVAKAADRVIIEQLVDTWKLVHDSGWINSNRTVVEPPVGLLKNEAHYRIKIMVRDANNISNESQWSEFETAFQGPDELIVRTIGQDDSRALLTIQWDRTDLPTVEFVAYEVGILSSQEGDLRVARIADPNQNFYEYPFPVSGRQYTVRVRQIQAVGPDELESRWAGNETSVEYSNWFIKDLERPLELYLSFPVYAEDQPQVTRKANRSSFRPQGRRMPVHYIGEERTREGSVTVRFERDDPLAESNQNTLYDLIDQRTVCILGTDPGSKVFAYLDDPSESLTDLPWLAVYDIPYEQTYYEEDVTLRSISTRRNI